MHLGSSRPGRSYVGEADEYEGEARTRGRDVPAWPALSYDHFSFAALELGQYPLMLASPIRGAAVNGAGNADPRTCAPIVFALDATGKRGHRFAPALLDRGELRVAGPRRASASSVSAVLADLPDCMVEPGEVGASDSVRAPVSR